jgi:hypothetical protein
MCFGGGAAMPETPIPYEKPDFGPLPSLRGQENIKRTGPQYGNMRRGAQVRSLLMPINNP